MYSWASSPFPLLFRATLSSTWAFRWYRSPSCFACSTVLLYHFLCNVRNAIPFRGTSPFVLRRSCSLPVQWNKWTSLPPQCIALHGGPIHSYTRLQPRQPYGESPYTSLCTVNPDAATIVPTMAVKLEGEAA